MNSRAPSRWYKAGGDLLGEIATARPGQGEAYVWFVGQHGFVVCLGGLVFYVDVILNDLFDGDGNSLRVYPPPFSPDESQRVDYVLCTHNHIDHLNLDTLIPLAKANPQARFVVPAPLKKLFSSTGIAEDRVLATRAGESMVLSAPAGDAVALFPVPAVHTRHIWEDGEGERDETGDHVSLGFVLKGAGVSVYHSGDTWVTPPLLDALRARLPVDIAMLPINGTDWERTAADCIGNMSAGRGKTRPRRTVRSGDPLPLRHDRAQRRKPGPLRRGDVRAVPGKTLPRLRPWGKIRVQKGELAGTLITPFSPSPYPASRSLRCGGKCSRSRFPRESAHP